MTADPDAIFKITTGSGDLPKLTLVAPDGARAEIYLYGAHVTSWIPAGGEERLFLSRVSAFKQGAPIRGGVPLVFPQFGASGPLPLHGIVRINTWEFLGAEVSGNRATANLRLVDSDITRALWPFEFQTNLAVTVGGNELTVKLAAKNTGAAAFSFTTSLHTYLSVNDLAETYVGDLSGLRYRDAAAGGVEVQEANPKVEFTGEVNRIYFNAPAEVRLVDGDRTLVSRATGFTDAVVWNPGAVKCATMADLEPEDYLRFVCVETATVGAPVELAPNATWEGSQTLVAM